MKKTEGMKNAAIGLAGILFILFVWAIAFFAVGNEFLLPSPWESFLETLKLFGEIGFYRSFFATVLRVFLAFSVSFVLGALFAVVAHLLPAFEKFFAPVIAVLRSLPTLAVLLMILVFATGSVAAFVVAVLGLFPLLYTTVSSSLVGVDKRLIEMCDVYDVRSWKRIKGLYLPYVAPRVVKEGGAALSFALKLVVSAEVLAATFQSVGGLMSEAKATAEYARLLALTVIVCLFGVLIENGANAISRAMERRTA